MLRQVTLQKHSVPVGRRLCIQAAELSEQRGGSAEPVTAPVASEEGAKKRKSVLSQATPQKRPLPPESIARKDAEMAADITHILLLKQEWADRVLSGEKSLEIRSTGTRKRGRIGIAVQNLLFGCVDLTGSMALTPEQLAAELPRHLCPLDEITYKQPHGWSLEKPRLFSKPIPFERKLGQVVWCKHEGERAAIPVESGSSDPTMEKVAEPVAGESQVQRPASTTASCDRTKDKEDSTVDGQPIAQHGGNAVAAADAAADAARDPMPLQHSSDPSHDSDTVGKVAKQLLKVHATKFLKLKKIAPLFLEQGRKTARGSVPDVEQACSLCARARHSCKWEVRKGKDGIRAKGSCCYSCVRGAAVLGCSRSVPALKEAGLVQVIRDMSACVAATQVPDLCFCDRPACTEKMKTWKGEVRWLDSIFSSMPYVVVHGGLLDRMSAIAERWKKCFSTTCTIQRTHYFLLQACADLKTARRGRAQSDFRLFRVCFHRCDRCISHTYIYIFISIYIYIHIYIYIFIYSER